MSDNSTKKLISAYYQEADPTAYFSGMFSVRPGNLHSSEEIEIDIVRSDEDISIVLQDLGTGYRENSNDLFTNKGFKPPVHKEAIPINSSDLLKRMAGDSPFADVGMRGKVIARMFDGMRKVERKIRRSIELQASQVMQTGVITLSNETGIPLYSLDYKPKATHFPTAGTSWASANLATKISDLTNLADVIRGDGLVDPDEITMGDKAFENLLQTAGFLDRFDTQRANLGTITSMSARGGGGIYRGTLELGNYKLDVFTYNGQYKHQQTSVKTKFMHAGKIMMRSSTARFDASFGAIPNIGQLLGVAQRLVPELPRRMSSADSRMDLFTNMWMSNDGEQLWGGVGARPLMIPTAIDTYGCLDTQLPA